MGALTEVADPVVACAGALRGMPGPSTAAALAAWTYQAGEPGESGVRGPVGPLDEVVDLAMGSQRLAGWALWCQLAAAARLIRAWSAWSPIGDSDHDSCENGEDGDRNLAVRLGRVADRGQRSARRDVDPRELALDFVSAELALACGLSRSAAGHRVVTANILVVEGRHPRVGRLARAGLVEWGKLHLLVTRLSAVEPRVAEQVERRLIPDGDLDCTRGPLHVRRSRRDPGADLPFVTRCTLPQLRAAIDAALHAIDPDGAEDRAGRARQDRSVTAEPESDGVARLTARGPAEAVEAIMADLDDAAATAKARGDARTCDQIRADEAFHRLTQGAYGAPANPTSSSTGAGAGTGSGAGPAAGGAARDATDDAGGDATGDDADHGAGVDREGEGCAASDGRETSETSEDHGGGGEESFVGRDGRARRRTQVSLTMPLATWLGLASQPGQLDGYGSVAAALARQIAADAARRDPATTTWRCVVTDDEHATVVGIGRPIVTPNHDAPLRVAALVRTAEGHCVFPGCTTPARRCDLDHRQPFPEGATCTCNLQPLCRGHHRLKTTGHLTVRLVQPGEDDDVPPGTLEWTTRAGRIYRSMPSQPVPPALEQALIRLPAELAEHRHISHTEVRHMNRNIAAAFARHHAGLIDNARTHDGAPIDTLTDTDETIERPPASIDDNPAPPFPPRPLETWNPTWEHLGSDEEHPGRPAANLLQDMNATAAENAADTSEASMHRSAA